MLTRRQILASMTLAALAGRSPATAARARNDQAPRRWAVLYAADAAFEALEPFDLLVFDRLAHPAIEPLQDAGKEVFGYISLGEMNRQRAEFARLDAWGILGEENPN